jgi:hypothetical protein
MSRFTLFLLAFFLAIMTILGLATIGRIVYRVNEQSAATRWPTCRGVVVTSTIVQHKGSKGRISYTPQVTYRYDTSNRTWSGSCVWNVPWTFSSSLTHASAVTSKYPVGTDLQVRYDPSNPEASMLEPGVTDEHRLDTLIGGAIVFGGMAFWTMLGQGFRSRFSANYVGGVRIIKGPKVRCRREGLHPLAAASFVAAGVCGLAAIIGADGGPRMPGWMHEVVVGLVAIALAAMTFLLCSNYREAGRKDVVLDPVEALVTVPKGPYNRALFVAQYESVLDTSLQSVKRMQGKYRVTMYDLLAHVGGLDEHRLVLTFSRKQDAIVFERWFREHLALEPREPMITPA